MAQDLRDLFAKERKSQRYTMREGHEDRFLDLLDEKLPAKKVRKKMKN